MARPTKRRGTPRRNDDIKIRLTALIRALDAIVYDWRPPRDRLDWSGDIGRILGETDLGSDTASWTSRLHPDERERVLEEIDAARAAGCPYDVQYRFRHADGRYLWMHDRGELFLDAHGNLVRMIGLMRDITAHKRAEQEVQAGARLRRLIFDMAPGCVKVVDAQGRLVEMNRAGLAMLEADSIEQARRRTVADYVVPEHRAAFRALHRRVMAGGEGSLEFEITGLRGARRWLETHAVPLRGDDGATSLLGLTRDITESREQQQRLARLARMREVMSAINALIVRTRSRTELFQEACRIAVEHGGFGLAWVGVVQGSEIVPVAHHGADGGYLGRRFSLDDTDPGTCAPTVRVVQQDRPSIHNDLARDAVPGAWRAPLLALGYQSFAAYPLRVGGRVAGCLSLYAREPGVFDAEEERLVGELTNDISFALEFIIKDETLDLLSIYDGLTRLPNRTLFMRRLPGLIQEAQDAGKRLALVMLDIEQFKALNDALTHAGGDELLKIVAERLKAHAGGPGAVARIAGDRFAVVLSDVDPSADIDALVRGGAWDQLEPPFEFGGQEFPVTLKVGVAAYPQDALDAEGLLRNAELALKHGKSSGRRFTRYTSTMGDLARRRMQLDRELRRALARGELALHYQPIADLRTGLLAGAEALLRWNSPDQGLVMPGLIIPLMEETGLIVEVGQWAIEEAVRQRAAWLAQGVRVPRTSVNLSALQLREKDLCNNVRTALAEAPAAARGLELEVTESAMMSDAEAHIATLRALRDLGLTLAMDDFGTGYSSLAYLARLPLNAVKIDRSFVMTLADPAVTSIVAATVALAHSLKLRVVAEGVETEAQLQSLRQLGCDEVQGFLLSPAVLPEELAAMARGGRLLPS